MIQKKNNMYIEREFRLIKEYPESPVLGTTRLFKIYSTKEFTKELANLKLCELFPEFWVEIKKYED